MVGCEAKNIHQKDMCWKRLDYMLKLLNAIIITIGVGAIQSFIN